MCGAPYGGVAPLYCRSCRAKQATGVADLEAYRRNPERFELVRAHPAFAAASRWRPRLKAGAELAQPIAVFLLALLWSGGMTAIVWGADRAVDLRWAFASVAGAIILVTAAMVAIAVARLFARPVQLVAVIAEDIARPARGGDPAGVANHAVTLRTADGRTRVVLATDVQMGLVALTDIGLAYVQGARLVEFRRFDVMPAPLGAGEPARPPACGTCAAPYSFESRTVCGFCGAALEHPDLGEHGARFAEVLAAPATAAARAAVVVPSLPPIGAAVALLGLATVAVYGLWKLRYLWFFLAEQWPWGDLILIPWIGVVLFAVIYGRRRLGPRLARRVPEVALIVRTREDAWATVNGRPVVAHYVTLAGPGGGRIERRAMPDIAAAVRPGQIGVAHQRRDWLAAWTPLAEPRS